MHRAAESVAFQIYQKFVEEGREGEAQIALNLKARMAKLAKKIDTAMLSSSAPREMTTSLSQVPMRYRVYPEVSRETAAQQLPRPVWELIVSFIEPEQVLKLNLVCRLLFHICSPACLFCTPSSGHQRCHSLWKSIGRNWPEVFEKYPEANCVLLQRCISQWLCQEAFQTALACVRQSGCAKGRHVLVDNPKNQEYCICLWCRRGVKKTIQCLKPCLCGLLPCSQANTTAHFTHKCTLCACSSPLILKSYHLLDKIRTSHAHFEVNVSGKFHEHRLFEFAL